MKLKIKNPSSDCQTNEPDLTYFMIIKYYGYDCAYEGYGGRDYSGENGGRHGVVGPCAGP